LALLHVFDHILTFTKLASYSASVGKSIFGDMPLHGKLMQSEMRSHSAVWNCSVIAEV